MAKDEIGRATRAGAGDVVDAPKQQDVAELLKKMKVEAEAQEAKAEVATESQGEASATTASAQGEQLVASADSIFASDAAPVEVASAAPVAAAAPQGGSGGGMSTGTLLAIGGVLLVGGGIAIAANNDDDKGGDDDEAPVVPEVTAVTASGAANEGQAVTFTVTGTPGSTFAYSITGVSASDVDKLSGDVTIGADGKGIITIITTADETTEGAETMTLTVGGKTATAGINDTSLTPIPPLGVGEDHIVGGAGDDVFNAPLIQSNGGTILETFENGDTADGGAGNDTLNLSLNGGTGALLVDTTSVETVNVTNALAGGLRTLYLADDTTAVSVTGIQPIGVNSIALFGEGLTSVALTNVNVAGVTDLTAAEIDVDVVNTRTTNGSPFNVTTVDLSPLFSDLDAASTVNLSITSSDAIINATDLSSDNTSTLNLTLSGGLGAFFNVVNIDTSDTIADVTVGGEGDVVLTFQNNDGIETLDASGLAGGVTADIFADYDLGGDSLLTTIKGGQGDDVLTVQEALADGAVVTANAGDDVIGLLAVNDGDTTVNLTSGTNVLYVADNRNGKLTVNGGTGSDAIEIDRVAAGQFTTVNGGDGADAIDLSGTFHTGALSATRLDIDAGAGDDVVDIDGLQGGAVLLDLLEAANIGPSPTFTFTPNVTFDGGAGAADTLVINAADAFDISLNDASSASDPDGVFNASVSGFERINVGDIGANTNDIDMDTLDGIDYIFLSNGQGTAINNIDSTGTVHFLGGSTDLIVNVRDATQLTQTNDVLNIAATSAVTNPQAFGLGDAAVDLGTVETQGVETVNFLLADTNPGAGQYQIELVDDLVNTITVVGNAGLELTVTTVSGNDIVTVPPAGTTPE